MAKSEGRGGKLISDGWVQAGVVFAVWDKWAEAMPLQSRLGEECWQELLVDNGLKLADEKTAGFLDRVK